VKGVFNGSKVRKFVYYGGDSGRLLAAILGKNITGIVTDSQTQQYVLSTSSAT